MLSAHPYTMSEDVPQQNARSSDSLLFLALGNFLPLIGALLWGWDTRSLLVLFWIDTVFVALFESMMLAPDRRPYGEHPHRTDGDRALLVMLSLALGVYVIHAYVSVLGPEELELEATYVWSAFFLLAIGNFRRFRAFRRSVRADGSMAHPPHTVAKRMLLLAVIAGLASDVAGPGFSSSIAMVALFSLGKSVIDSWEFIFPMPEEEVT